MGAVSEDLHRKRVETLFGFLQGASLEPSETSNPHCTNFRRCGSQSLPSSGIMEIPCELHSDAVESDDRVVQAEIVSAKVRKPNSEHLLPTAYKDHGV